MSICRSHHCLSFLRNKNATYLQKGLILGPEMLCSFPVLNFCWFSRALPGVVLPSIHLHILLLLLLFLFLRLHLRHMEVPRLEVQLDLQLPAYATATAMWDLSHICNLHHSSLKHQILTYWARPGIEPTSSWISVGFVTTELQREFCSHFSYSTFHNKQSHTIWNFSLSLNYCRTYCFTHVDTYFYNMLYWYLNILSIPFPNRLWGSRRQDFSQIKYAL